MNFVSIPPTYLQELKVRSIHALLTRVAFVAVARPHQAIAQGSHTWH